jgi:hypothetical protein
MHLRDDDQVSAVALVVESEAEAQADAPGGDELVSDEVLTDDAVIDDDSTESEGLIAIEPDEAGQLGLDLEPDDENE